MSFDHAPRPVVRLASLVIAGAAWMQACGSSGGGGTPLSDASAGKGGTVAKGGTGGFGASAATGGIGGGLGGSGASGGGGNTGGNGGTSGSGGSGGAAGSSGSGASGGSAGASGSGASGGTGGTGGTGVDAGPVTATITQITNGTIAPNTDVVVKGAVVMSQPFLVAQSGATASCLWGVFVSEPNLTETKAYSGILVASYGSKATVPDGGTKAFCPRLGIDSIGSGIPDNAAPGDVVDITGKTAYFLSGACTAATDSKTKIRQILAPTVTKTGTATVPPAHAMSAADELLLSSPALADQAFHDKWGNVKVRIANVTAVPQGSSITNAFGQILVNPGNLLVGDTIYYRGYSKFSDACYDGPKYSNASQTFTSIEGFSYLDFCTWSLEPNSKCKDFNPPSNDCAIGGADAAASCTHY